MKILGIILAFLMLIGSAFVAYKGADKANKAKNDISEVTKGLSSAQIAAFEKQAGESIPSTGRLGAGRIVGLLGALAAIGLLVVAFAKKQLVGAVAGAAVGLALLSALIYPYIKTGPLEGMAPRPQAFVATVLAVIGAAGAWLYAKKSARA